MADQTVEITEEKQEIPEEDKLKAAELKQQAINSLNKYLELSPDAKDKETVTALIEECNSFINGSNQDEVKAEE